MMWIEVPGLNLIHATHAWEEDGGDTVVVVAPNLLPVENALERMDLVHSSMERIEINLKEKTVTRRPVSGRSLDFAVINPAYVGKKTKYIYAAEGGRLLGRAGLAKIDLSLCSSNSDDFVVASRLYGPGCYGGESFFVAREPDIPAAEEDDGYLMTYVHNENTE
ncbi:UNVERIFIED_CONTAM: putative carotenoid cleavage dioxygenase 4, chloroplastic [Sesamum radiatum]|uniref:Carotenoid cleavage dioxygenase 4, chloroplastic n=1 Tax=Sesamum radiatum TaxID=300843 RepID=A0AAW2TSN2_SESRA